VHVKVRRRPANVYSRVATYAEVFYADEFRNMVEVIENVFYGSTATPRQECANPRDAP
jgi:hypothetical protein